MRKFRTHNFYASKLTPEQVFSIRERYAAGETQGALAREFAVSVVTIGRIVRRESWQGFCRTDTPADYEAVEPTGTAGPTSEEIAASLERVQASLGASQTADVARRTMSELTERAQRYGATVKKP